MRGGWHGLWVTGNERAARLPCPADARRLCFHRRSRQPDRGCFQLCEPWGPCLNSGTAAPKQPGRSMNGVAETNITLFPKSSSWARFTHPALKPCTSLHGQAMPCNKQAPSQSSPGSSPGSPCPGRGSVHPRAWGRDPEEPLGVGVGSSWSRGTRRAWVDGGKASPGPASRGWA